jgi:hypothetical protein
MSTRTLALRLVPGLQVARGRAVGFLEGHPELDAGSAFDEFEKGDERAMRANMEHWVAGNNQPTTKFHGFPNDLDHKHCFVFKHHEHRLYGFLCHPRPKADPRFQLCALCIYAAKHRLSTDDHELRRVEEWMTIEGAVGAIRGLYPEYRGEGAKWKM